MMLKLNSANGFPKAGLISTPTSRAWLEPAFRRAGWGTAAFPRKVLTWALAGAVCLEAVAPGRPGAQPHPCGGRGGRAPRREWTAPLSVFPSPGV